jgi:hypothetical protein
MKITSKHSNHNTCISYISLIPGKRRRNFFQEAGNLLLLFVWHLGCISNWIWIWGKSYKITSAWIVHLVKKIYLNYCISYHLLNVYMLKSFVVQMAHLFFISFFYVVLWFVCLFVCFICLCLSIYFNSIFDKYPRRLSDLLILKKY